MSLSELNGGSLAAYLTGVMQGIYDVTNDQELKVRILRQLIRAHSTLPINASKDFIKEFERLQETLNVPA